MSHKSYMTFSGAIFLLVGIAHLLRIVNGWPVAISTFFLPMWVSWVAVILVGILSYQALRKR